MLFRLSALVLVASWLLALQPVGEAGRSEESLVLSRLGDDVVVGSLESYLEKHGSLLRSRPTRGEWEGYESYRENLRRWRAQLKGLLAGRFYFEVGSFPPQRYDAVNEVVEFRLPLPRQLRAMRRKDGSFQDTLEYTVSVRRKEEAQRLFNAEKGALRLRVEFEIEDVRQGRMFIVVTRSRLTYYEEVVREWK